MFRRKYCKLKTEEHPLVQHHGIFRRQLTLFEAVALIVSATVGAGVLSIPYAVSKVGIWIGLSYVVVLGFLMIVLNLMIGEVAVRTTGNMQLVGMAKKYLGKVGGIIMTAVVYFMVFGVLLVYTIGQGEALSAIFGGSAFNWSLIFLLIGTFLISVGLKAIKKVEFFLSLLILFVILFIIGISVPHVEMNNFNYLNFAALLLPYGVILFAYHGTTSVPEAHALLADKSSDFKKAIIIAGLINMVIYALFAVMVVAVTGSETSEIATIALGSKVGKSIFLFGNIFAILAMGTSFLMNGLALKDSMCWDYKMPNWLCTGLVGAVPFGLFVLGLRNFIAAIDIVGGVFVSLEMLILLAVYWQAKQKGDLDPGKYKLHHTAILGMFLFLALAVGAVYSVVKLF